MASPVNPKYFLYRFTLFHRTHHASRTTLHVFFPRFTQSWRFTPHVSFR